MSDTDQPPKPERHWYQFSLKTLLIAMTIAIVAFGVWVQYRRQRAQENRERVAAIEEAEAEIGELGMVFYEEVRPQTWMEKQFDDPGDADDPAGGLRVWSADLDSPSYYGVLVFPFEITDADLEPLKVLTSLRDLSLETRQVTNAGIVHLKGLTRLESLNLGKTSITDAGLVHLKGMTRLETLHLDMTSITDAGLVNLKGMTKLKELNLSLTHVTDSGLKHLKGLMELEILKLGGLGDCEVTDAGLEHLIGLTNLKELHLYNSQVTDEGVERLQQALPNCETQRFVIVE